jgi:diaminopimelate epimerase
VIPGTGLRFVKGHGTQNDFVLLPDLDGTLELSERAVRRLCDRRSGLGADGVLRVVPSSLEPDGAPYADQARFFMDHRNADGSLAEMCGNGVRLYGRFLVTEGLMSPGAFRVATRAGVKELDVEPGDGQVTVDMGPAEPGEALDIDGAKGTFVSMGNPHAVVPVESVAALGTLDPARKDLNVEYVEERSPTSLVMRVHERGVGETQSCGTGACAAVVAHSLWTGTERGTAYDVEVPGGQLVVTWRTDGHVLLRGPAVLGVSGTLDRSHLEVR